VSASPATGPSARRHGGPAFWVALAVGWLVIAWAVRGVWRQRGGTVPRGFARWFVGLGLLHDLVVLPVVLGVGWLTGRLPTAVRRPVQAGLATTAVVTVFAWPLLRGYSRRASNRSVLPLDYTRSYVIVLCLVWGSVLVLIASGAARRRIGARGR
jgi:hypothetical protein